MIPSEWRKCPPVKLDSSVPGMEAIRVYISSICVGISTDNSRQFQYMALVHYACKARGSLQDASRQQHALETSFSKERKQRRESQSNALTLAARMEHLEEVESKLKMWEARKPKIFHYLGVFGDMMKYALCLTYFEAHADYL